MSSGDIPTVDYDLLVPSSQQRLDSVLPSSEDITTAKSVEDFQGKQVNHSSSESSPKHLEWKSIGPVEVESLSFDPNWCMLNNWSESLAQSSLLASVDTLQVASKLSDASLNLVSEREISDASPPVENSPAALTAAQVAEKLEVGELISSSTLIPAVVLDSALAIPQCDEEPGISDMIIGKSMPIGPQGAWKKPLSLPVSHSIPVNALSISGVSPLSNWPALSASKQSSKRLSNQVSGMPPCPAKRNAPEISVAEEESLKEVSRDYPWAAKMDQSLRNLHRVTKPEYMEDGTPLVNIPSHVLLEGLENQKEFVVGQFYRCAAPSGGLVHAVVNRIWGRNCRIFTRKVGESSYLFHIPNETTRKWIMQRGIWHVDDCLMFVSAWTPAANITLPEITTIPAWLTLKNIPHQLYSIKGIKWIASGIGEPMLTSRPWLDPTQMGEAKILVEVKLDKPFPQRVALKENSGKITMVDVIYSWLPSKCNKCGQLGHKETRCLGIGVEKAASVAPHSVSNELSTNTPIIANDVSMVSGLASVSESDMAIKETEQGLISVANPSAPASSSSGLGDVIYTEVAAVPETGRVLADNIDSQAREKIVESSPQNDFVLTTSPKAVHSLQKTDIAITDAKHSVQSTLVSGTAYKSGKEATCFTPGSEAFFRALKGKSSSSNQFAALDWGSDLGDSEGSDDDIITDLTRTFTDRLLRDRPVKPSTKATEMAATLHSTRGRGQRGRGRRGGRG